MQMNTGEMQVKRDEFERLKEQVAREASRVEQMEGGSKVRDDRLRRPRESVSKYGDCM